MLYEVITLLLPWRKVGLAAAACLALLLANRGLELYQLQQTEQALKAQTVQLYKRLFPGETRVVNPRAQLRQHLLVLQGGGGTQSPLTLLAALTPAFAAIKDLRITSYNVCYTKLLRSASGSLGK